MVPLTPEGHGQLMKNCITVNQALVEVMHTRFSDTSWIELHPLAEPDTVGYCFVLMPRSGFDTIAALNEYTERIWKRMTVDGREDINQYDFLVSKTEVEARAYEHVLRGVLPDTLVTDAVNTDASLTLLRTCIMNPFLTDWAEHDPPFQTQLAAFLHEAALNEHLSDVLPTAPLSDDERVRVAVVEPEPDAPGSLLEQLQTSERGAAHLSVTARHPKSNHPAAVWDGYDAVVLTAETLDTPALATTVEHAQASGTPVFVCADTEAAPEPPPDAIYDTQSLRWIIHDTSTQRVHDLLARLYALQPNYAEPLHS
jgi:hypothetical protein